MSRRIPIIASIAVGSMVLLAGCSSGSSPNDNGSSTAPSEQSGPATLKVQYLQSDTFTAMNTLMTSVKTEFEAAHKNVTVELQPVTATDTDYDTKLSLSLRSASTAPDVFYEDTFQVKSDIEAGYLLNLDSYLKTWPDWSQFNEGAKAAGQGDDGSIYAISLGTDTRVIWYSIPVMKKANVTLPWQPKTWQDILDTAAKIKAAEPGVVPFTMYAGTGTGEGTVMQSFYELLYGTGNGLGLYDASAKKWIVGSQGFIDSLTFLETLYKDGYAVTPAEALDPNVWKTVLGTLMPEAKAGGTVEGSYTPSFWEKGGPFPWPAYTTDVGTALFPTQNGEAPGGVSMSGGWTLAASATTKNPDLAFEFMSLALNHDNALSYAIAASQIAVRTDVAAEPTYLAANPFQKAVTDAVSVTHYRPATSDYPKISSAAQTATESVITGKQTPQEAAAAYDTAVEGIVGADMVTKQ